MRPLLLFVLPFLLRERARLLGEQGQILLLWVRP